MTSWKYHKKLMNPMLIRFELFFCGIQMKKPETQYIQIAFTQLTISDRSKYNILLYIIIIIHECGKNL